MRLRIVVGKKLIRLGAFVQSLAVAVMRPDDLIEFSRMTYAKENSVASWSADDVINSGLNPDEEALLKKIPLRNGRLLLLGVGGGREAIPLAKMGFEITAVDFIPAMVVRAVENAKKNGLKICGLVQEMSKLDMPENAYDIVWLAAAMYSCIPTRKRRTAMLRKIYNTLKPGGFFLCQFHWAEKTTRSKKTEWAKKIIAVLSGGNFAYEKGDMVWANNEFIHAFSAAENFECEFKAGGFEIINLQKSDSLMAGAILKKPLPG